MIIYHACDKQEYDFYLKNKFVCANKNFIDPDFIKGYNWMSKQMKKRNIFKPSEYKSNYPVWGWYKYNKLVKNLKPDFLEYMFEKGTEYYVFKLNIPKNRVLLSDHDFWEQTALCYNTITCMMSKKACSNIKDDNEEEIDKWYDTIDYLKQNLTNKQYIKFLNMVWKDMFITKNCDYIQATFWGFWEKDVIKIYKLTSNYSRY